MKIDYAIVSTNNNPIYSDFWDIVKRKWNEIGIKPIKVYIDEEIENDITLYKDDCIIFKLKAVKGINTGFQAQVSRMYITKYFKTNTLITSDIDMIPLSKNYFVPNLVNICDNKLAILSSDAYKNIDRYPICYNVAKGSLFSEILELDKYKFDEYCNMLLGLGYKQWDTDELYFGKMVNNYKDQDKIVKLKRGWKNGIADKRIDRVNWKYDPKKLNEDYYIDSHSLRPLKLNYNKINKIL